MPSTISFVIPAYNESRYIQGCIDAIVRATAANGLKAEIIVVDNGSQDDTAALARAAGAAVISMPRSSVAAARNLGAAQSSHPIIAFIDADVEITPRWAATLLQQQEAILRDDNTLTGHVYAIRKNPGWIERHWFGNLHDRYIHGGNVILSRSLFNKIGGFDAALRTGEDFDLCERAIAAGANYYEEPGYEAIHLGFPRTLRHFVRREVWHGEGDYQTLRRFVASPVALIAMLYLALHLLIVAAVITGSAELAGAALAALLLANLALTWWRFPDCSMVALAHNAVLNYFYFVARAMSLFAVWRNKLR